MRPLVMPHAAQRDENAVQILSAWIAEKGFHCTMNVGMWSAQGTDEPWAWGAFLAEVVRHLGMLFTRIRAFRARRRFVESPKQSVPNWTRRRPRSAVTFALGRTNHGTAAV